MKHARSLVAVLLVAGCGGRVENVLVGSDDPGAGGAGDGGSSTDDGGGEGSGGREGKAGGTSGAVGGASSAGGRASASSGGRPGTDPGGGGTPGSGGISGNGGSSGTGSVSASGGSSVGGSGGATSGSDRAVTEVWVGQVQRAVTHVDYESNPPVAEHVVLVLETAANGTVKGSVVFGKRSAPPLPTDPDAFYPPLDDYRYWGVLKWLPLDGFAYSLVDLHLHEGRVTGRFSPNELWSAWCAIQPKSYPAREPSYPDTCVDRDAPFVNQGYSDSAETPSKGDLCRGISVCTCESNVCSASASQRLWNLDLQRRDGLYEGEVRSESLPGGGTWLHGVRLRRVE